MNVFVCIDAGQETGYLDQEDQEEGRSRTSGEEGCRGEWVRYSEGIVETVVEMNDVEMNDVETKVETKVETHVGNDPVGGMGCISTVGLARRPRWGEREDMERGWMIRREWLP